MSSVVQSISLACERCQMTAVLPLAPPAYVQGMLTHCPSSVNWPRVTLVDGLPVSAATLTLNELLVDSLA